MVFEEPFVYVLSWHFLDDIIVVEIPDVIYVAKTEVVLLDNVIDEGLVCGSGNDNFFPVVWVALSRKLHFTVHETV
jgi:hypothetical protein